MDKDERKRSIVGINIFSTDDSEATRYAASELSRCLRVMLEVPVEFQVANEPYHAETEGISVGLSSSFPESIAKEMPVSPEDDAILVRIRNGCGVIAGSNGRSVLIGVYRFLHSLGCRWPRPGAGGEFIPRMAIEELSAGFKEEASFRHRTICIEGAVSVENVLDIIDWAPKVGFSGFFMQFPDGYAFFSRWYFHKDVPGKEAEPFSRAAARIFTIRVEQEIRRRGLTYHAVGHGWTCKALGLDVSHWDPVFRSLSDGEKEMLAEVNGERTLQWDRPMITSLCFSRADVRRRMVAEITRYASNHPEVDLLHVWLDDGGGKCECANCRPLKPSDWYVKMLHELDEALTAASCPARIVFISYADLLWPPAAGTKPLKSERFSFVYANGRPSYDEAWKTFDGIKPVIPTYVRNKNALKGSQEEFLGFLHGWQSFFSGDSMLFEYYLTAGRQALDQYLLAKVIHGDVRRLKSLDLNGLVSCQVLRCFFPTGLAMYAMGQTLWREDVKIEALIDEYFLAAFGNDSALCKEFVKVSGEELIKAVRFDSRISIGPDAVRHLGKLVILMRDFSKVVERNMNTAEPCHSKSWFYMRWYLRILERMVGLFRVMVEKNQEAVLAEWDELKSFIATNEDRYQAVFDVWNFVSLFDGYILNGRFSSAPEANYKEARIG